MRIHYPKLPDMTHALSLCVFMAYFYILFGTFYILFGTALVDVTYLIVPILMS